MGKRVAIFCGSSSGEGQKYKTIARTVGKEIARRGLELVYGGGNVGLMGVVADAALEEGGTVIGVIPVHLKEREIAHRNLTELIVVETMHQRKFKMAELADIFMALPGGFGTLDEFFEIVTWALLGLHTKACAILNCDHFYTHLLKWIDHSTEQGFIKPQQRDLIIVSSDPVDLIEKTLIYEHTIEPKWSSRAAVET